MEERGILFDNYHTAKNWYMILNAKSLTPPEPKTNYVTVDGRNGDLDLSEALTGEITYENRDAEFTLISTHGTYTDREKIITQMVGILHGRKHRIVLPDDLDHYLIGRCTISDITNNLSYCELTIEATCEPWKYAKRAVGRVFETQAIPSDIMCVNDGVKTITPELTVTGTIRLITDTVDITLTDGKYKLPDFKLYAGKNIAQLSGDGTLSITYQEAIL